MTRREFIGMASAGAVAIVIAGRLVLTRASTVQPAGKFPIYHSDAQWRAMLSPASYQVLRQEGTEAPFSSALLAEHRLGIFACAGCGKHLFDASTKFDSHTGWPSFWDTLSGAVGRREDHSFGELRTEVHCMDCGGHLGHVFNDGPKPTGLRYCMNGVAMGFEPASA